MKKALFVVDMINDFIRKDGPLYSSNYDSILLPVISRVVEYKQADLPIAWICDEHTPDDNEFKRFPPHATVGTKGAEVIKELRNLKEGFHELFYGKRRFSGFFDTRLADFLEFFKPDVVELCGVCTSICILFTAVGLYNRDIPTVIHRNCVADFDMDAHNFALKHMENILGTIII